MDVKLEKLTLNTGGDEALFSVDTAHGGLCARLIFVKESFSFFFFYTKCNGKG